MICPKCQNEIVTEQAEKKIIDNSVYYKCPSCQKYSDVDADCNCGSNLTV